MSHKGGRGPRRGGRNRVEGISTEGRGSGDSVSETPARGRQTFLTHESCPPASVYLSPEKVRPEVDGPTRWESERGPGEVLPDPCVLPVRHHHSDPFRSVLDPVPLLCHLTRTSGPDTCRPVGVTPTRNGRSSGVRSSPLSVVHGLHGGLHQRRVETLQYGVVSE